MTNWVGRQMGRMINRLSSRQPRRSRVHERVVELRPDRDPIGRVLVAYILDPFLQPGTPISNAHTHDWETWHIVQSFLARGFAVDVISFLNQSFRPDHDYAIFFAARTNFQRIAEQLSPECLRVVHLDTAHWLFNNTAACNRLLDVQRRRGVTLANIKMVEANWAVEHADLATILGNQFTIDTYAYANKPIYRIPISAPEVYDFPEHRNLETARHHFLWFGSSGFVHKGLDLVLEAFAELPNLHLHVCGPFEEEAKFLAAYDRELHHTANIHAHGWVDVAGETFRSICEQSIGIVYPTASEGGGGSVISCMHQGLVPIVSYEASVDTDSFGVVLAENTVNAIREAVLELSMLDSKTLENRSRASWTFARQHHTKETFAHAFDECLDGVLLPAMRKKSSMTGKRARE